MEYKSGAVSPIESISKGWEMIKDNYWLFFGMNVVFIILLFVVAIILGLINNGITFGLSSLFGLATQDSGEIGRASAAVAPQFISMFIGIFTNILVFTFSGVMVCGIYNALAKASSGEVVDFGDLFSGFEKLMPCLVFAVVMSILQFVIGVVTVGIGVAAGVSALGAGLITQSGELNPALVGGVIIFVILIFLISLIANLIISILTTFVYPIISQTGMSGGQALMLSVKSGFSNFFGLLLLLILVGLMALGGALVCFVGILFVSPVIFAAIYAAFESVFGTMQDSRQHTPPAPPTFGEQPSY